MRIFPLLLFIMLSSSTFVVAQKEYTPDWESLDSRPTPNWWLDAKFGIFIHWGVYAVPAWCPKGNYAEWYQYGLQTSDTARQAYHRARFGDTVSYYDFGKMFNPVLFRPHDWAQLFEKAGAKYVVLTAKHHDGYCLWPSQHANQAWGFAWNAYDCAARRDLVGELFDVLRKTTVQPGLYFSLYEWFNPLWKTDRARYARDHAFAQLDDLVQRYRPKIIWADGDWDAPPEVWQSQQWLAKLFNESPVRDSVVINDRWGSGVRFRHGGIFTPEYQPDLDFEDHPWEESRGMGFSYGYNRAEDAWDYSSTQVLLLHLVDKVSRGGNFLLDIGPDELGQIPPIMQQRLLEMGQWLQLNGEAIYETRRWRQPCQWSATGKRNYTLPKNPHQDDWKIGGDALLQLTLYPDSGFAVKELFFTYHPQKNHLFAIFPKWPDDNRLVIRDLQLPDNTLIQFLENGQILPWKNIVGNQSVEIQLPVFHPQKIKSQHLWVVKINQFGHFSPSPKAKIVYDFATCQPYVHLENLPSDSIFYSTDGSTPTPAHALYRQPIPVLKGQQIKMRIFSEGKAPGAVVEVQPQFFTKLSALPRSARKVGAKMYLKAIPKQWSAAGVGVSSVLDSVWTDNIELPPHCLSEKCAVEWIGTFYVPDTGGYEFFTASDDGSQLFIDNQLIVSNDGLHGIEQRSGIAFLEKGFHRFRLTYFNAGGGVGLQVGKRRVDAPAFVPLLHR